MPIFSNNGLIDESYFKTVNDLIVSIEQVVKKVTGKYKSKDEVNELLNILMSFISNENLTESQLQNEFLKIEKSIRKNNKLDQLNKVRDYKERIKFLNTELKCMKTMLEKCSSSWEKFNHSFDSVKYWLENQKSQSDLNRADYVNFQKLHSTFNDSANFLLQVSDSSMLNLIKEKVLYLNKNWKLYQEKFKNTQNEQLIKYYECQHTLAMIKEHLIKIETLANLEVSSDDTSLKRVEVEYEKAMGDLNSLDSNFDLVTSLIDSLDAIETKNLDEFHDEMKICKTKLHYLKNLLTESFKTLSIICLETKYIDESIQTIEGWIMDCGIVQKTDFESLNYEQIVKQIEKQKNLANYFEHHHNSINANFISLNTLKELKLPKVDYCDLDAKLEKVRDSLNKLNEKFKKSQEFFQNQQNLWQNFRFKTIKLEEWILEAQKIVTEKSDNFDLLVENHKKFFEHVDDEILNGFLKSGQELLACKNESDKMEIKNLMETLEGKLKMILSQAPIRLLKLKFKQLEFLLKKEVKEADQELNDHLDYLNKKNIVNMNKIIEKYQAKFNDSSDFFSKCQSYLNDLKLIVSELGEKKIDEKTMIENTYQNLEATWINMVKKIEKINERLYVLPNKQQNFETNLKELNIWMVEFEFYVENLYRNDLPYLTEYVSLIDKTKEYLANLNDRKDQLNVINQEYLILTNENMCENESRQCLNDLNLKFKRYDDEFLYKLQNRMNDLTEISKTYDDIHTISNKLNDLKKSKSTNNIYNDKEIDTKNLEELESILNEKSNLLEQMRTLEVEIQNVRIYLTENKNFNQIPLIVKDQLNNVQQMINTDLNKELCDYEKYINYKLAQDEELNSKLNKVKSNLNIIRQVIENSSNISDSSFNQIISNGIKNVTIPEDIRQEEFEYYLRLFYYCNEMVKESLDLLTQLNEIKIQLSVEDSNSIEDIRSKLALYENDINTELNIFQKNLDAHDKIDNDIDDFYQKLSLFFNKNNEMDLRNDSLVQKMKQCENDLNEIENLKNDLNQLIKQKLEILDEDNRNLNESCVGSLQENFNTCLYEVDIKKDNQLNELFEKFKLDLISIEDSYLNSLKEIKTEIENGSKKTDIFNLDYFNNNAQFSNNLNPLQNTIGDEYILYESDNILLEKISFNETGSLNRTNENNNFNNQHEMIKLNSSTLSEIEQNIDMNVQNKTVNNQNEMISLSNSDDSEILVQNIGDDLLHVKVIHKTSNHEKVENEILQKITVDYSVCASNNGSSIFKEENHEILEHIKICEIGKNECSTIINQLDSSSFNENLTLNKINRDEEDDSVIEKERQKIEIEILNCEQKERERVEKIEKAISEMKENERLEQEKAEREALERNMLEREKERLKIEMIERDRLEKQRMEQERLEKKRLEKLERERLEEEFERERIQKQFIEEEKKRNEILERERQRLERESLEKKIHEREKERELLCIKKMNIEKDDFKSSINENRYSGSSSNKANNLIIKENLVFKSKIARYNNYPASYKNNQVQNKIKIPIEEKYNNSSNDFSSSNQKSQEIKVNNFSDKKIELMIEMNRPKNERKLELEFELNKLCQDLNKLKDDISNLDNNKNVDYLSTTLIDFEQDLKCINRKIDNLCSEYHLLNNENHYSNKNNQDSIFLYAVDQAALSQFDLIKSFSLYLNTQLETKREILINRKNKLRKLNEHENNLNNYIELASKFIQNDSASYVQNLDDLDNLVESIKSIENSIELSMKQINDINNELNISAEYVEKILNIESNILKPLAVHWSHLTQYLHKWRMFDKDLVELKMFLKDELQSESLIELKDKEINDCICLLSEECNGVEASKNSELLSKELKKYLNLSEKLSKKLIELDDFFDVGTSLFDESNSYYKYVVAPQASKEFNEIKDIVNVLSKFLDEKCACLNYMIIQQDKLMRLNANLNDIEVNLNKIIQEKDILSEEQTNQHDLIQSNLEKLSEMKRNIREILDEKDGLYDDTLNESYISENSNNNYNQIQKLHINKNSLSFKHCNILKNNIKLLSENLLYKISDLENDYNKIMVENLSSRKSLIQLIEWVRYKADYVETITKSIYDFGTISTSVKDSFNELDTYKRDLIQINNEIKDERECLFNYISDSIEKEMNHGFYDLSLADRLSQMKKEWFHLKSLIKSNLEILEMNTMRINEFEKSVIDINEWLQSHYWSQTLTTSKLNKHSNQDDKKILLEINSHMEKLKKLKESFQDDSNLAYTNNEIINQISQSYIKTRLNELENSLEKTCLISKMKLENNLNLFKQDYTIKLNDLNNRLETEVNFIEKGKLTSRISYENSIKNIRDFLNKINETKSQIKTSFYKFEKDLQTNLTLIKKYNNDDSYTISFKSIETHILKQNNILVDILNNNYDLETKAKFLLDQSNEIIKAWARYEQIHAALINQTEETKRNIQNELDDADQVILKTPNDSDLLQRTLNDMLHNKKFYQELENASDVLLSILKKNENTRQFLEMNKKDLQEKFSYLSEIADKLSNRLTDIHKDHQLYLKLADKANNLIQQAKDIIETKSQTNDFKKNLNMKLHGIEMEECENKLIDMLRKLKKIQVKDIKRINKIYEMTNSCSRLISELRTYRIQMVEYLEESNYSFKVKVNDIKAFINEYLAKLRSELSIEIKISNEISLFLSQLNKILNGLKFMTQTDLELDKCEKTLNEIENNDEKLYNESKTIKKDLSKLRKQIKVITASNGLFDTLNYLKELDFYDPNCQSNKIEYLANYISQLKSTEINLEKISYDLIREGINYIDINLFIRNHLAPFRKHFEEILSNSSVNNELINKYSNLEIKVKLVLKNAQTSLMNSKNLNHDELLAKYGVDVDKLEMKFNFLKDIKASLTNSQFKTNIDELKILGNQIRQKLKYDPYLYQSISVNHDTIFVNYLNLLSQLDQDMKKIECEFINWKLIVQKSKKLIDLTKQSHKKLASISFTSFKKSKEINFDLITNNKNSQTLNEWIDFIKTDILQCLKENEYLKNDILELSKKPYESKSNLIRDLVSQILSEWDLINEKAHFKLGQLESFRTELNDLDNQLTKIRELIFENEYYLEQDCFCDLDFNSYENIINKSNELEELADFLKERDNQVQLLFKQCLHANSASLNGNKNYETIVQSIKERWNNLKINVNEKIYLLKNTWTQLNDLCEQTENINTILDKTEHFYRKTVSNAVGMPNMILKLFEELYLTIKDDYKLIKYLNESYVKLSRSANYFEIGKDLECIKKKLIFINSQWDYLQNEIAKRIRQTRQEINSKSCKLMTKESYVYWIKEINLLITNLEYLSTKELQLKYNEIYEIKKEICEQTDLMFKYNILAGNEEMSNLLKDLMKRIIRLDAFVQNYI